MGFDYTSLATNRFEMPKGWCIVLVQDVATVNEESIKSNYRHRKIEYIDIASVEKGTVKSIQELLLDDAPSRAKRIVRDNDTLIATVRPNLEHYVYIKKAKQNTIASTGFAVVTAKKVNPRFLYYYLTTKPFTSYLTQIADSHTSAYPAFNPDIIETAQLLLPPPSEQLAIATILGTLDDKIELNRRMNQTLETMAQSLFKSWFVDFEPFHDQGMDDSKLGPIPKDWSLGKVNNIAVINREGINPSDYPDEVFDHYSVPAFDEGRMPKVEKSEQIKSNKFQVPSKAILISKLNPRFPRVWFPTISNTRRSVCSTEFLVALPKENTTCEYLYSLFCSHSFREVFSTFVTGTSTSHQRVRPEDFLLIDLVVSPKDVITQFSAVSSPLYEKMAQNLYENSTLATTRDTLLPKLLSGEIKVKDAEKFVEKAK